MYCICFVIILLSFSNQDGKTALDTAKNRKKYEVVMYLRQLCECSVLYSVITLFTTTCMLSTVH